MRELILGIDPGLTGAWALLDFKDRSLVHVSDMPRTKSGDLDSTALWIDWDCSQDCSQKVRFAILEEVSGGTYVDKFGEKRGQGSAASFAFGRYAGILEGILAALLIPTYFVKPSVWKLSMKLTKNKNSSIELAKRKFPNSPGSFSLKKHHGRAEAALLALFGAERFK